MPPCVLTLGRASARRSRRDPKLLPDEAQTATCGRSSWFWAPVVRRGVDLVKRCSPAPHLLDDLFGGLAPDERLGIVVPVLGPQLYRLSQRLDAREHAWRRRRSVRSLNQ